MLLGVIGDDNRDIWIRWSDWGLFEIRFKEYVSIGNSMRKGYIVWKSGLRFGKKLVVVVERVRES